MALESLIHTSDTEEKLFTFERLFYNPQYSLYTSNEVCDLKRYRVNRSCIWGRLEGGENGQEQNIMD